MNWIKNRLSDPTAQWIGVGCAAALWAVALVGWTSMQTAWGVRDQLIRLCPTFLWIGVLALALALWVNRDAIIKVLREEFSGRQWIAMAVVCLMGLCLVRWAAPRTHRLFYDEDIYQAIGLNIAHNNQAAMINDGRWEFGRIKPALNEFNKQPNGWPFVISLAYRIFGVSERIVFNLSNILFAAAVFMTLLAGRLLFKSWPAAVFAALIYAFIPENLRWFATMDGDPPTAFFSAVAVLTTLLFLRKRSNASMFLMTAAWAFAVHFRFEVLLMLGLVFAVLYIDAWEEFKQPRLYGFFVLFLFLLLAHEMHMLAIRNETWGASGAKLADKYFWQNLRINTFYYFDGNRFPALFGLLALAGAFWPGAWKPRAYAALWFLLAWTPFLFFYAGSYNFGVDVRFSMMSMVPLALLAGRGAERLASLGQRWASETNVSFLMILLLTGTFLFYLPSIRAIGSESYQCRDDHEAAEYFATLVPPDGIVMTHDPNMFEIWGKNAAQMSLFTENSRYALQSIKPQFNDKIYLHWNYWCNTVDPVQVRFCTNMLASYLTEPVAERFVRGKRYGLYRVVGDRNPSAPNALPSGTAGGTPLFPIKPAPNQKEHR